MEKVCINNENGYITVLTIGKVYNCEEVKVEDNILDGFKYYWVVNNHGFRLLYCKERFR